jgi:ribosomal protein L32
MTDQPKPDQKPEAEAVKPPVTSAPEPGQEKLDSASNPPPSAPLAAKSEPTQSPPLATAGDEAVKSVQTTEAKSESSPAEPKPTAAPVVPAPASPSSSTSDPTQPSKERMSTLDLNDPRFKGVANSLPGSDGVVSPEKPAPVPSGAGEAKPDEPKATQRLPDPSSLGVSSAPAPAANICPTCGHRNRPGVLLCDNCGTNLMTGGRTSVGTRDLKKEDAKSGENLLDTSQRKAVDTAGGSIFNEDMVLRIEIEGGSTPMLVYPKQEIIMGRRDPNTGGMPDVDLTTYAGYRMGVSRRHAAIRLQEQHLHVSDLGSSNGTFLNGTRLNAHRPYQLRDGDEVRLGQMVLRVFYQTNKDRK